jgi:hypothetical protein
MMQHRRTLLALVAILFVAIAASRLLCANFVLYFGGPVGLLLLIFGLSLALALLVFPLCRPRRWPSAICH